MTSPVGALRTSSVMVRDSNSISLSMTSTPMVVTSRRQLTVTIKSSGRPFPLNLIDNSGQSAVAQFACIMSKQKDSQIETSILLNISVGRAEVASPKIGKSQMEIDCILGKSEQSLTSETYSPERLHQISSPLLELSIALPSARQGLPAHSALYLQLGLSPTKIRQFQSKFYVFATWASS